jgi:hypothetical protein
MPQTVSRTAIAATQTLGAVIAERLGVATSSNASPAHHEKSGYARPVESVTSTTPTAHLWRILREQVGWSWQRPARRTVERNDEAIHHWVKQRWPQFKKARRKNALIVFEDESGVSLLPSMRATWLPRGHTRAAPSIHLEPADAGWPTGVRTRWQRRASRLPTASGTYNDKTLIEFLTEVNELEQQRPVVLIWDGQPTYGHRRRFSSSVS